VEIEFHNQTQVFRLLSGIVMNFPVAALPFKPAVRVEDRAVSVYLIPLKERFSPLLQIVAPQRLLPYTSCIRLEHDQTLKIRLTDRHCCELFLDEDPLTTYECLTIGVAGSIAFVPGPNYLPIADLGVAA
jgi:hypothetical protein